MGQTTWTGAQLGHSLSGCRVAGTNLLLAFNEHVPDEHTLGLWHMNEGIGNSVADASGHGHTVTLSTVGWAVPAWMGNGLSRAAMGTPSTPAKVNGGVDYTIELWFALNGNPANFAFWDMASFRTAWNRNNTLLTMRAAANLYTTLRVYDSVGGIADCSYTSNAQADGNPHHLAGVRDNGVLRLYLDGVQRRTMSPPAGAFLDGNGPIITDDKIGTGLWLDELRVSSVCRYPDGTTFFPTRYPASGTGTVDPATAINGTPGLFTVTLSEALPAGTSLKAKLLSTTGGDTGFQTLTGSGTSYSYDFTGQPADNWYPSVQLFAGGALNANTPTVTQAVLDWTAVYPRRGGTIARFGPSLVRWCL